MSNHIPEIQFRASRLGGYLFLKHANYLDKVKSVSIVYTPETQPGYILRNGTREEIVSFYPDKQDQQLTLYIHYNPETLSQITDQPGWFDEDVYAGICLALEGKTLGWQGCRQKPSDYYEWVSSKHLPGIIKQGIGLFGWQ